MPQKGSRTSLGLKNIRVNTFMNVCMLLLNFFSRKIFIECLGAEVVGLNSTVYNILEFLNFAELGIVSGVRFMLYKPVYNSDYTTINEIITLQGYLYKKISLVIIFFAAALMGFIPIIFGKMNLPLWYAYASFGVLLYSSIIGNFVNYRQIMFHVSQHSYRLSRITMLVSVVKICCQMAMIYFMTEGYVWWLVCEVVFTTVNCIVINIMTKREYPFLKKSTMTFRALMQKYRILAVKVRQLFFHRICAIALTKATPVIIYSFTTLAEVTLYGNYKMIVKGIETLSNISIWSIGPGIGNLVAEGNRAKTVAVFHEVYVVRLLVTSIAVYSFLTLSSSFITLWLGEEYVLGGVTVALIVFSMSLNMVRTPFDMFLQASGMFQDVWAPIVEVVLNLGFAVVGGYVYGLNGILGGSLVGSSLIVMIWKPYFLFRHGLGGKCLGVYSQICKIGTISAICVFIVRVSTNAILVEDADDWLGFVCNSIAICTLYFTALLILTYAFDNSFRRFMSRFLRLPY